MSDEHFRKPSADPTLVLPEILQAAMEAVMEKEAGDAGPGLATSEPWLDSYVRDELLRIAGRLTMAGISPCVARGVACDVRRTLAVAAQALRFGYGALLDGLMLNEAPPAADHPESGPANGSST